jgi:pyruvate dehydrogenase E1 component alpha subunit
MSEILTYWGGDERGSDFSGPRHDFACSIPIATQSLHAAGAALAFKLRGEKRVAVTQVGDGGSSKGDFLEAINAASAFQLPLVLVIVNNQWAISTPRSKQNSATTLAQKGIGGGLPSIQVDGNDVIACRWVLENAIEQARAGKGPTVIEMMTYRLTDHTTADDARHYRKEEEVENAWRIEPIKRLRKYLMAQGVWSDKTELVLLGEASREVEAAVAQYLSVGEPEIGSMFDCLYANMPAELEAQRTSAIEEHD